MIAMVIYFGPGKAIATVTIVSEFLILVPLTVIGILLSQVILEILLLSEPTD